LCSKTVSGSRLDIAYHFRDCADRVISQLKPESDRGKEKEPKKNETDLSEAYTSKLLGVAEMQNPAITQILLMQQMQQRELEKMQQQHAMLLQTKEENSRLQQMNTVLQLQMLQASGAMKTQPEQSSNPLSQSQVNFGNAYPSPMMTSSSQQRQQAQQPTANALAPPINSNQGQQYGQPISADLASLLNSLNSAGQSNWNFSH